MTVIGNNAFQNSGLRSVKIPGSVEVIGAFAFLGCYNLQSVELSEGLISIEAEAFQSVPAEVRIPSSVRYIETLYFYNLAINKPYEDGLVVFDGWIIRADPDLRYITDLDGIEHAAVNAYLYSDRLKNALWSGGGIEGPNVETLLISNIPSNYRFIESTVTLRNIVILDSVKAEDLAEFPNVFSALTGVTIFLEGQEEDYRWDENFPGWSNGNRVVYGDEWGWSTFYDENGEVLYHSPRRNSEVIRRPGGNLLSDDFVGWDLDGDGKADHIPAVMSGDIVAHAVVGEHVHYYRKEITEPTCTEDGCTTYTCRCGDSYTEDPVEALGHSYKDGKCTRCDEEEPQEEIFWGDATGDDTVDYLDAMMVLRHAVKLTTLSEEVQKRCDVDHSNNIDYLDAMLILRYAVKLIDKFPAAK